jgi:L-serine/L-threonine ammonia-lyase
MLHHDTPLLRSTPLSALLGADVWLKLDALQPSGSFKLRGMGLAAERAQARGARGLLSSSGGNAGLAVAVAGRALGLPVTVVVPSRTDPRMRGLIAAEGATVVVAGEVWDDAHAHALGLASEAVPLLHPFDHPDVWEGHATLVAEVAGRMPEPAAVVLSVGGGGLLCGVVQGMKAAGWSARVLAAETQGAASYAAAVRAGRPVTLERIDTVALTLGARTVCARSLALDHPITPWTCSDAQAVDACRRFLDDHRILVEPACGAALAAVYGRAIEGPLLVVVCGGAAVTAERLAEW